jgi:hypothetical protein
MRVRNGDRTAMIVNGAVYAGGFLLGGLLAVAIVGALLGF